jgi:transcriptional accessory protein Tex/SPT6
MKERVAIATVQGKAYFLIVNKLREQNISFISLTPGEPVPPKVRLVITTEQEKSLVKHEKILVFHSEDELDNLINELQKILLGKEAFERIVIGVDPGEATGLAVVADGKVIEEGNCYSTQEVINNITKAISNVNFFQTAVSVKIGNGVPVYKELLEALDGALPPQVALEVVSEAGTNKPLKENRHSRGIRHISSAIHIAGRTGHVVPRRKQVAANSRIQ